MPRNTVDPKIGINWEVFYKLQELKFADNK